MRFLPAAPAALLAAALAGAAPPAADPVVVDLPEQAVVKTAVATLGDVARVSGGDPAARGRVARLDVLELKPRESSGVVTRGAVEFRLRLAGVDPAGFALAGADRVVVTVARRTVTADEVVAAARAELVKRLPCPPEAATIELTRPVVVRLPDVPAGEPVTITAQPRNPAVAPGRTQMDVTISAGGEALLGLGVVFDLKVAGAGETLVRPRQRVTMVVRLGATTVSAVGEARQAGTLGQTIEVENVDSKKVVAGRVSGPGTVEVELGGVR